MAKTKFKDEKDIRDKMVHIAFSENEITKIDEYVNKHILQELLLFGMQFGEK